VTTDAHEFSSDVIALPAKDLLGNLLLSNSSMTGSHVVAVLTHQGVCKQNKILHLICKAIHLFHGLGQIMSIMTYL
jgi:hypothetical protein